MSLVCVYYAALTVHKQLTIRKSTVLIIWVTLGLRMHGKCICRFFLEDNWLAKTIYAVQKKMESWENESTLYQWLWLSRKIDIRYYINVKLPFAWGQSVASHQSLFNVDYLIVIILNCVAFQLNYCYDSLPWKVLLL